MREGQGSLVTLGKKKPKVAKLERVEQSTRGKKMATTFFGFPNKQPDNFTCL